MSEGPEGPPSPTSGEQPLDMQQPPGPPNLVRRDAWGAMAPRVTAALETPVPYIVMSYTGTPSCHTAEDCLRAVQDMQASHMTRQNLPDIRYNFVIGGDGNIYEGRGWTTYAPPACKCPVRQFRALNYKSISVAMIGDFEDATDTDTDGGPPKNMVQAGKDLIKYGKDNSFIQYHGAMWKGSMEKDL